MDFAGDELGERSAEQQAVAMIAAARGYNKREDKPYWWGHFQRMEYPVDEWADTAGVLLVDRVTVEEDWRGAQGRERKGRRRLRLCGGLESGALPNSTEMTAVYDSPAPASLEHHPSGRACHKVTIDWVDDPSAPTAILATELAVGGDQEIHSQVPFALTSPPPIQTGRLNDALNDVATAVRASLPQLPRAGYLDVLARRPPRRKSALPLPRTGNDIDDITAAVMDLDNSYLAVHGPPGCGKTHTAARVIANLVNGHGWRVGVVAQSHSAVENLLDAVVDTKLDPQRIGKKVKSSAASRPRGWQVVKEDRYPDFIADPSGCVIGGTAWDFANPDRVPPGSLDLLVVEEAGQFCLAYTIAASGAARNLLLLGDPQQLPQVSQGTHCEPVDESALGWLIDGAATLDPALGYFLAQSWRMHSQVCEPVSRLSYGGQLTSNRERTDSRRLDGYAPGLHELLVDHEGNSTDSLEEAEAIVAEITELLGTPWSDEHGARPLGAGDVLVVAAYNAQVVRIRSHLEAVGLDDVLVGTVDKFQGREAPVVFFSLAASSAEDAPRGISFLINRNRVNVAISRAKYAAFIVRSPRLTDFLPAGPAGLVELGAFLALTQADASRPGSGS